MDVSDPSSLLVDEVSRKARDLVAWYTTIPDMMCILDEDGRTSYYPVPVKRAGCSTLDGILQLASAANAAGVGLACLSAMIVDAASVEVLVVLGWASENVVLEITPIARECGIRFGASQRSLCDLVSVPPAIPQLAPQPTHSGQN